MKGVKTLITIYTRLKNLAERNNTINALVIAAKVAFKSIDFIDVTRQIIRLVNTKTMLALTNQEKKSFHSRSCEDNITPITN